MNFNLAQPFLNVAMAWIKLLGLLGYMYKRKILLEIGGMVGSVVKLDLNTDSRTRGRVIRLTVYVSLHKPLIFKVLINDKPQRVEYEILPSVCFECGRYGHIKETCPNRPLEKNVETEAPQTVLKLVESVTAHEESNIEEQSYGPWMLVEQRIRRRLRDNKVTGAVNLENTFVGSIFIVTTHFQWYRCRNAGTPMA
ncbi:hypothetical protein Gorai_007530 [Gossypium raimondii]|uniref:CCHC-type domain-containing protein n=1 Tax=Gossypium raimondii TaxID=29730 RepID=A0A7J8Q820_GOSRA|nr:hypothetical protein [Gossypium raimondii]